MRTLIARFISLFRKRRLEEDLDQELRSHIELATEANLGQGMSREHARRAALLTFGGIEQTKEIYRDQRGLPMIETMLQDIRYGLRMLARSPGFTAVAVLSLALGIGANTAIFTLIDAVLLKMLPVKNPKEIVLLRWAVPAGQHPLGARSMEGNDWIEKGRNLGTAFSYPAYREIRARGQGPGQPFSEVFAFKGLGELNVLVDGQASLAFAQLVSGDYFHALGVNPAGGRMLTASDDHAGAPPVCVISNRYWQRRFGGETSAIGKSIAINGAPVTIVGITPPEFFGLQLGEAVDISLPLATQPLILPNPDPKTSMFTASTYWWVLIMGRLNPGVSEQQAIARLEPIFQRTVNEKPSGLKGDRTAMASLEVVPGSQGIDGLRRQFSRPLLILMGMVGMVLLIACANVANLLLARATTRRQEIGVRLSLGAPRSRLIRQLLTESLLLSSLGGVLGLALAWWGSRILVTFISSARNPIELNLSPDLRVLCFAAGACIVTGLLFGLMPALRATRVDLTPSLKRGARAGLGGGKMLVVAQAALSVVLLFGAGLFVRTLVNLESLNTGFDKENLLLFGINAPQAGYKDQALKNFYIQVQQRLSALPGAVSATASSHLLLSGGSRSSGIWVPGYTPSPEERSIVRVLPAGPDFFRTMKLPLLRGRDFSARDSENAPGVAVVNEAFVKRYFDGRDPMGQRIRWDRTKPDMEIIGVAKDAKYNSLRKDTPATVYHPFTQANIYSMHFEVRTVANPKALIPDVRRAVAALDRNVPLYDVKTQTEQIDELLIQERLFAKLMSFFGGLALLLACVGLYGLMSYAVARRTGEIGIRMALGARRGNIIGMVLGETLWMVAAGLALGIQLSLGAGRLAQSAISDLLFGLKATDIDSAVFAGTALVIVAAVAGFVPARRASRVDPMVALRHE